MRTARRYVEQLGLSFRDAAARLAQEQELPTLTHATLRVWAVKGNWAPPPLNPPTRPTRLRREKPSTKAAAKDAGTCRQRCQDCLGVILGTDHVCSPPTRGRTLTRYGGSYL